MTLLHSMGLLEVWRSTDAVRLVDCASGAEVSVPVRDLVELVEQLERLACEQLGHLWSVVSKEPVLGPFNMCTRCGKWER